MENQEIESTLKMVWDQLGMRKWLVLKRTFLMALPAFLILSPIIFVFLQIKNTGIQNAKLPLSGEVIIPLFIFLLLMAVVYSIIVSNIFKLEKHIWLDSYFDQKNLTPQESWTLAKRLCSRYMFMRFQISIKYYVVWLMVFALALLVSYYLTSHKMFGLGEDVFTFTIFIGLMTVAVVWIGVRSHLKYFAFVFLDKFGKENSDLNNIIAEMKQLNQVNGAKSWSLSALFGTLEEVFLSGTSQRGGALGSVVKSTAYEYSNFARLAADYNGYRRARQSLYGASQEINANLYSLIGR